MCKVKILPLIKDRNNLNKMTKNEEEEYYLLTDKLEEIEWAIEGKCNDIDCDKYMYKDLLKKKYKPVLEHNFSCMKKLKREKEAVLRILSQKRYIKYCYLKCNICKKSLDKLSKKSKIVSFTRPISENGKVFYQWNGVWTHNLCASKVKIPRGWNKA